MILQSSRLARWSVLPFGVFLVVASSGACGNSNSTTDDGGPSSDDSGMTTDGSGDSTSHDGSSSSSGGSSGSSSGSSGGDSSTDGSGAGDGGYSFDGFADAVGSDGTVCVDDDGDGWTNCNGDCNDHDSLVNPCAFDTNDPNDPVGHDGIDNDCDGKVDNLITCEQGLMAGHDTKPSDYANASDLCDNPMCTRLNNAIWYGPNVQNAHRITNHMGTSGQFKPKQGNLMSFLSSGIADDLTDTPNYRTGDGTDLGNTFPNPMPLPANKNLNPCGMGVDESTPQAQPHDYTELRMTITAPINAGSFSFDFAFFSEEYPVYVCQGFNDTFLAVQTSQQFPNGLQISYDQQNPPHRINVNSAFFQDCNSAVPAWGYGYTHNCTGAITLLNGTGYEIPYCCTFESDGNGNHGSGGTDWLTTTSPVNPGEQFTLSWVIFDEHDGILDSAIILDHFHWHSTTLGNPVTGR